MIITPIQDIQRHCECHNELTNCSTNNLTLENSRIRFTLTISVKFNFSYTILQRNACQNNYV